MDYHSLTRRELQFLCKRNKIPANITNLAMADALTALQQVEGLEEMMNPDVMQSPARIGASGKRTSARRKPIREVEVSQPLTHARGTRSVAKGDLENTDANVPRTPAIRSSSRRKTPAASACRKLDSQMKEEEEEGAMLTPALTSSRRRAPTASAFVQRVYNTRLSVKLLESTVAELSLNEGEKSNAVKTTNLSMDSSESGMQTPDELHDISVSDETQDKNLDEAQIHLLEISKNGQTENENGGDGPPVIEFSSEVLNEVSTVRFSLPRETKDFVEYSQLNDESKYPEEICENLVGQDSDINMGEDVMHDEPKEENDDGSLITNENPSTEVAVSLDFPKIMEDSDSGSEWTDEDGNHDERKVSDKKTVEDMSQSPALSQDDVRKVLDEIVQSLDLLEDMEESDSKLERANRVEKDNDDSKVFVKKPVEEAQSPTLHKDDVMKVSDKVEQSLDLMVDSYSKSKHANKEEKDDDSKVSDKKQIEEAAQNLVLPEDGISKVSVEKSAGTVNLSVVLPQDDGIKRSNEKPSEKPAQAQALPKDKRDFELDFEGDNFSDSENPDDVPTTDKNKTPKCNKSPQQISPSVEAEFSVPTTVKTPSSVRPTPFQSQLRGDQVTDATPPQQPLADDVMLPYQFSPPTKQVEGLKEMMSPDVMQSPSSISHTGSRTSARRKPCREVEVSHPLTQPCGTRVIAKGDQERTDANIPRTPAIRSSSRRKTLASSACQKLDAQMKKEEEGTVVTPALTSSCRRSPTGSASVHRVYNASLSVKLLEETVAKLSLNEGEKSNAAKSTNLSMDNGPGMETPAVSHYISVAYEIQDQNPDEAEIHLLEINKNEETVNENGADRVPVIEFSSEVLNEVSTVKFYLPQETKDFVEYNQLNDESKYQEEICENLVLVGQDSDINMGQDDEHGEPEEETDDGSLVTDASSEATLSLYFPEDSDSKSEWTDKDYGSLITDEDLSSEAALSPDFLEDMEDSASKSEWTDDDRKASDKNPVEDASQSPVLPQDDIVKVLDKILQSLDPLEDMEDSDSKSERANKEKDDGNVLDKKLAEEAAQSPALLEDDVIKVSGKVEQSLDLMEDLYSKPEHANKEEKDDDSKVLDKKPLEEAAQSPALSKDGIIKVSDKVEQSLVLMEDSYLKSERSNEEEKDCYSKVSDKNPILHEDGISKVSVEKSADTADLNPILPQDDGIKGSNEKPAQAPTLLKDEIDLDLDFEEDNLSDPKNPNDVPTEENCYGNKVQGDGCN